jgi:hypothetical protein
MIFNFFTMETIHLSFNELISISVNIGKAAVNTI